MPSQARIRQVITMLRGLLADMHDAGDSQLILERILGRMIKLMKANRGDFVVWDEDRKDLIIAVVHGERVETTVKVGEIFPAGSFIRALWVDKKKIFRISPDVSKEEAYYSSDARVRSEIAIRLEFEKQPIGIFNIESFKEYAFREKDLKLLKAAAPYVTTAVQIARRDIRLWSIVQRALGHQPSPKPEEGLDEILKSLYSLYHLNGLIYIANEQERRLECVCLYGDERARVRSKGCGYSFDDHAAATWVRNAGKPEFFEYLSDPRINQEGLKRSDIQGPFGILPLANGQHMVGVLVFWRNKTPFVNEHLLTVLEPFARLAAAQIVMREQARGRFLFESLMKDVPYFVYFKDAESHFIQVNEAFAKRLSPQLQPNDIVGKTDFDFFAPEHAIEARNDELEVMRNDLPSRPKEEKEVWLDKRPDTYVLTTKIPLRDPSGQIVGTFGISHDVTESEYLQRLTDQLALAGVALSNAHDFKKPLSFISLQAKNTRTDLRKKNLEHAMGRIEKIIQICQEEKKANNEVLMAAKTGKIQLDESDLNALISDWIYQLTEPIQEKQIKCTQDLSPDIPKISISRNLMHRAFKNVCLNALSAMRIGEALLVTASLIGSEICIEVRDGGPGFPQEMLSRRRPPFMVGNQSQAGLGLTIVYRIMQLHSGRMELGNNPEGGASVKLIIPIKNEQNKSIDC